MPKTSQATTDFPQWVIYNSPSDFPGKYVVRRWVIQGGDNCGTVASASPLAVVDTIDEARAALPFGVTCLGRSDQDDPCIVEVWI